MRQLLDQVFQGLTSLIQVKGHKPGEERRRIIRVKSNLEAECETDSSHMPATVLDISSHGMCLRVSLPLDPGTEVRVLLADADPEQYRVVRGDVRWCRRQKDTNLFEVGLEFPEPPGANSKSWVYETLRKLGMAEGVAYSRRKLLRAGVKLPAKIVNAEGAEHLGQAVNLGMGGCRVDLPLCLVPGTLYNVTLGPTERFRPMKLRASVKQSEVARDGGGFLIGLEFENPSGAQIRRLGDFVLSILRNRKPPLAGA